MIAKCSCQNCSGKIEFEADGFQPRTRVECPHCKMETLLFIPPADVPLKNSARTGKNSIAVWLLVRQHRCQNSYNNKAKTEEDIPLTVKDILDEQIARKLV